jgi:hypothetical protein
MPAQAPSQQTVIRSGDLLATSMAIVHKSRTTSAARSLWPPLLSWPRQSEGRPRDHLKRSYRNYSWLGSPAAMIARWMSWRVELMRSILMKITRPVTQIAAPMKPVFIAGGPWSSGSDQCSFTRTQQENSATTATSKDRCRYDCDEDHIPTTGFSRLSLDHCVIFGVSQYPQ